MYSVNYDDKTCCVNSCLASECPEDICLEDFPGYRKTYEKLRAVCSKEQAGLSIDEIAQELKMKVTDVIRLLEWKSKIKSKVLA